MMTFLSPGAEAKQLLVSLGRILVRKGLQLLPVLPWGNTLVEIARDTWEDYLRNTPRPATPAPGSQDKAGPAPVAQEAGSVEINLRVELESLVRATPAAMRQQVDQVAREVAGDHPPEAQQALANYLLQVPAMVRRSLRRPSDPTGTTLPGNMVIRNSEDLVALLPPRPARFKPGDRPLPGVDWVLEEMLGVGGFGEVWKAHHAQLKGLPPVALKFCLDDEAARTLRNEAGVLSQVMQHMREGRHEGIVQLRQAYLQAATPCLEYEYVPGGDLAGLIQELHHKGRPSAEMAAKIVRRLAETIGSVHQQRPPIVHRDLKPANILVQKTASGKLLLKVADFGIGHVTAREAILTSTRGGDSRSALLSTRVQGSYTPLYASPQQIRGDAPDPRDDVYALGVIWFQLLTGDLGSGAPSGMRWARDLAQQGIPQNLIDLLASCFESNPAHRPATGTVLAEQLSKRVTIRDKEPRQGVGGRGAEHVPPPSPPPVPGPSSSPPPVPVPEEPILAELAEEDETREGSGGSRGGPENDRVPATREARRGGETAAFWFLLAGIGNLAMAVFFLAAGLADFIRLGQGGAIVGMFFGGGIPGVAAAVHFLASGSLKNLQGRGKVILAVVFGSLYGLAYVLGTLAGLGAILHERGAMVLFLLLVVLLCGTMAFVNVFAAIRGILVLNNAAAGREFRRLDRSGEVRKPVFSKNLVLCLAAGLGGWFLVVLVVALVSLK